MSEIDGTYKVSTDPLKIKQCPFCGKSGETYYSDESEGLNIKCVEHHINMHVSKWQCRPIEDAQDAIIVRLEKENGKLQHDLVRALEDKPKDDRILKREDKTKDARIVKLEGDNGKLQYDLLHAIMDKAEVERMLSDLVDERDAVYKKLLKLKRKRRPR